MDDRSVSELRIETAIELYVLSYFEPRTIPRFLLQCTALEALAPACSHGDEHTTGIVDRWISEANREGLPELAARVGNLKTTSHGKRILEFARTALERFGVEAVEEKVQRLKKAYSARGMFLHDGDDAGINVSATDMHDILPLILKSALAGDPSQQS